MTIYVKFQNSENKFWWIKIMKEAATVGGVGGGNRLLGWLERNTKKLSGVMEMFSSLLGW